MRCPLVSRQPRTLPVLTRPLRRLAAPGFLWLHKVRLPVLKAALGLHWHMPASMDRLPSLSAFPWVVLELSCGVLPGVAPMASVRLSGEQQSFAGVVLVAPRGFQMSLLTCLGVGPKRT